jgi:hypothetical protein
MKVSNDLNPDTADTLALQIEDVIKRDPELTHGEILLACMIAIGSTLHSIQCRDCRRLAAKYVKKEMPSLTMAALASVSGQADSTHRH